MEEWIWHRPPCQQASCHLQSTSADKGDKCFSDGLQMLPQLLPRRFSQFLLMNKFSGAENAPLGPAPCCVSFDAAKEGNQSGGFPFQFRASVRPREGCKWPQEGEAHTFSRKLLTRAAMSTVMRKSPKRGGQEG